MSYQALYRAWRPQTFVDLIGQPHVRQTLVNAVHYGEVAHAYLFCGPRGTGKTSAAKVLAKAVNCLHPDGAEPCNECEACLSITNGRNVDVEEIDAASNRGVDEIRQLREKVQYAPASVAKKVYIVDEVHMLTTEAFNALLKTLEEPPAHTIFILATTEPHKIPATIISRCQRFDFRRIEPEIISVHLRKICESKNWEVDDEALWRISEAADGGLRDALGLLEQTAAFASGKITAEAAAHVMGGVQTLELLQLIRELVTGELQPVMKRLIHWYSGGKDATRIVYEILQLLRDLFIVKLSTESSPRFGRDHLEVAQLCQEDWLLDGMQKLGELYVSLRYVQQPRIALEAALLGMAPRMTTSAGTSSESARSGPTNAAASTTTASSSPTNTAASTTNASSSPTNAGASTTNASSTSANTSESSKHGVAQTPNDSRKASEAPNRRLSSRSSGNRKLEVLRQLADASTEEFLEGVQAAWDQVLSQVKGERIATHAWLMNGHPVLATSNTVVVAFSSRIHRDAVMKQDERNLIEQVLTHKFDRPMQLLALLQSDWTTFQESLVDQPEVTKVESGTGESDDFVSHVMTVFGPELVKVKDKE